MFEGTFGCPHSPLPREGTALTGQHDAERRAWLGETKGERMSEVVYLNPVRHLSSGEVHHEVWLFKTYGYTISDACAQAIAASWHSPGSPNSTRLSTMGAVTDDMEIGDFASESEYDACSSRSRSELDALEEYIATRQEQSETHASE